MFSGIFQTGVEVKRLVDVCCQTDFVVVDVDLAELKQRMASGVFENGNVSML